MAVSVARLMRFSLLVAAFILLCPSRASSQAPCCDWTGAHRYTCCVQGACQSCVDYYICNQDYPVYGFYSSINQLIYCCSSMIAIGAVPGATCGYTTPIRGAVAPHSDSSRPIYLQDCSGKYVLVELGSQENPGNT